MSFRVVLWAAFYLHKNPALLTKLRAVVDIKCELYEFPAWDIMSPSGRDRNSNLTTECGLKFFARGVLVKEFRLFVARFSFDVSYSAARGLVACGDHTVISLKSQ